MSAQPADVEMVSVLEEVPELGRDLPPEVREEALVAALAPVLVLEPGVQPLRIDAAPPLGHLGYLVLEGLVTVQVRFGSIWTTEFLGPSDVFRPWAMAARIEVAEAWWETLTTTQLAVLDRDFATRIREWPELTTALLDRYTERLTSQLLQSALRKARRVEDRIWVALWHFAARWGRVSLHGYIVELPKVTGEVLANIVGARRQSVSTALSSLMDRGAIQRRPDGSWLIMEKPPHLVAGAVPAPRLVR